MKCILVSFFLLWALRSNLGKEISGIKISYEDLKELNATCYPRDTCSEERSDDTPGISWSYSCSCDRLCSKLGTCCIDSLYRDTTSHTLSCRRENETLTGLAYYMVDKCSKDSSDESMWKHLCEEEWHKDDDVTKLAPVTSLHTSTTYKNYYCFRCHETTDEFFYWNLLLQGDYASHFGLDDKDFSVTYNSIHETWMATVAGKGGISIPVGLKFLIPDEMLSLPISCDANVISSCSGTWTDKGTTDNCNAYTAIIFIKRGDIVLKYKNAHCALCNFETLDNLICKYAISTAYDFKHFSFSHLLDINRSDGDKVGKIKKCENDSLWDPYGKTCRKITCALPGYVIKDGQCSLP